MRKMTKAFQLKSIQTPVFAVKIGDDYYPCVQDDKEIFIRGEGWKKIGRKKKAPVANLPENWTAKDLQAVCNKWGYQVGLGLVASNPSVSMFEEHSYSADSTKCELVNMMILGEEYDTFTDAVEKLNKSFLDGILKKGFSLKQFNNNGSCLYYKDKSMGSIGAFTRLPLYPSLYIDHSIWGMMRINPLFDPIAFDKALVHLLYEIGKEQGSATDLLDSVVSVKDRIAYLSNEQVANEFEKVFWAK